MPSAVRVIDRLEDLGSLDAGARAITNLLDPTTSQGAATKAYVDAVAIGLDVKASVRAATTANVTLSGEQTIDGVAVVAGDRVLVKNQTTASANGIYVVAAGAWARSEDANTSAEVTPGMFTFIEEGTVNGDSGWVLITNAPITLGTTSLTFTQFTGGGGVTAGDGLTQAGSTINVGDGDGIDVTADAVSLSTPVTILHGGTGNTTFGSGAVVFSGGTQLDGNAPKLKWDNTNFVLSTNGPKVAARLGQSLELHGADNFGGLTIDSWNATAGIAPVIDLNRSKSATVGTHAAVAAEDALGHMIFQGSDGTNFVQAGYIMCSVDGTPGTNDMPGTLRFFTTPDGAAVSLERMRIKANGSVIIGHAAAAGIRNGQLLEVNVSANYGGMCLDTWSATAAESPLLDFNRSKSATIGTHMAVAPADTLGNIVFRGSDGANFENAAMIKGEVDGTVSNDNMPGRLSFWTTPTSSNVAVERMRIRNTGVMVIGWTNAMGRSGAGQQLEVNSTSATEGGMVLNGWSAVAARSPLLDLNRSKSSTVGTHAVVAQNDALGAVSFRGSDGTAFMDAATITSLVDGTPGPSDMPGRLLFSTTPDGSATAAERMKIDKTGQVSIGTVTATTQPLNIQVSDNGIGIIVLVNVASTSVSGGDLFMSFQSTTGEVGSIAGTAVTGVIAYSTFTGSHWTELSEDPEPGTLLEATGEKLSEEKAHLWKSRICRTKRSPAAVGAYGGRDRNGNVMVLSLGTGVLKVANTGEDLDVGDYLVSSDVPGCAEKQPDDLYRSSTVAKVMERVKWRPGETERTISVIYLGG